jgi:hypothetical protein
LRRFYQIKQTFQSERGMNTATMNQVESVETKSVEGDGLLNFEALRELSEIELAYVGGGQYIATFI